MSNKTIIQSHNTRLNNLLEDINNLPEAGGIELPALDNEGAAADILSGKQFINQEGEIVEGTMHNNGTISQTMDGINTTSITIPSGYTQGGSVSLDNTIGNEVTTQTDLIAQIAAAVDGLPEAGEGGGTIETCFGRLTIDYDGPPTAVNIYYVNSNEELVSLESDSGCNFYPIKNSIIYLESWSSQSYISGNIQQITHEFGKGAYFVTGDFTLISGF